MKKKRSGLFDSGVLAVVLQGCVHLVLITMSVLVALYECVFMSTGDWSDYE